MENEELTNIVTTCDENPDKQHSIVNGPKKELTSADIEATVQLEREKELAKGEETVNIATTTSESGNDNKTTVEVVKPLLGDKNAREITANTVEVQKSITSTVNEVSAVNDEEEEGKEMVTKTTNSHENVSNNDDVGGGNNSVVSSQTKPTSVCTSSSLNNSPSVRYSDLAEKHHEVVVAVKKDKIQQHEDCELKLQQQMLQYEQQMEQLKAALQQKDNMITLFQRENAILEKEKEAVSREVKFKNLVEHLNLPKKNIKPKFLGYAKLYFKRQYL